MLLHQSKFGLCSEADFPNTRVRAPISAEHSLFTCMKGGALSTLFELGMVIYRWLCFVFLINRRHLYRRIAVVSLLNNLILAVDLWSFTAQHLVKLTVDPSFNSSTLLYIHHAASHDFHCYAIGNQIIAWKLFILDRNTWCHINVCKQIIIIN